MPGHPRHYRLSPTFRPFSQHSTPPSLLTFFTSLHFSMARFLYRILRVVNFVGSVEESQLRGAMRSSAVMSRLQSMIAADLDKPLSYALPLTGNAMAPLFNADIGDMTTAADRLVIRRLSGNTQSFLNRVYVNDVVVIRDPNDARRKYVRRISALEGAHMASDNEDDTPFRVPPRHCWVERDNQEANTAPDSTYFGPLSLDYIIGRVMYAIRSATDHGRVANSSYAMASDSIVLAQEPITMHLHPPPEEKSSSAQGKGGPVQPPQ